MSDIDRTGGMIVVLFIALAAIKKFTRLRYRKRSRSALGVAAGRRFPSTVSGAISPWPAITLSRSRIVNRSSFLIGELFLGKLGETVVVHGNAPHTDSGTGPECGLRSS